MESVLEPVVNSASPAPLSDMPEKRPLRVAELKGSPPVLARLYAMGVLPGTTLEIRGRAGCDGSLCVCVRCCSLVVDACLARGIYCTLAGDVDPALRGPAAPDQGDCACCGHFERRCADVAGEQDSASA